MHIIIGEDLSSYSQNQKFKTKGTLHISPLQIWSYQHQNGLYYAFSIIHIQLKYYKLISSVIFAI